MCECYFCGKKLNEETRTIEHLTPISRLKYPRNIEWTYCCHDCNHEKSNMTEDEYENYLFEKERCVSDKEIKKLRIEYMHKADMNMHDFEVEHYVHIDSIKIHERLGTHPTEKKIEKKIEKIMNGEIDPLILFGGTLVKGYSRFIAYERLGVTLIPVCYCDESYMESCKITKEDL